MNKDLIIGVLNAYMTINDGCLTVITNCKVYNNCYIRCLDLVLNLIYINENKGNNLILIKLDNIIGIQLQDEATLVGMK